MELELDIYIYIWNQCKSICNRYVSFSVTDCNLTSWLVWRKASAICMASSLRHSCCISRHVRSSLSNASNINKHINLHIFHRLFCVSLLYQTIYHHVLTMYIISYSIIFHHYITISPYHHITISPYTIYHHHGWTWCPAGHLVGAIATKRAEAQGCSKTSNCPSLAPGWWKSMVNHMTQMVMILVMIVMIVMILIDTHSRIWWIAKESMTESMTSQNGWILWILDSLRKTMRMLQMSLGINSFTGASLDMERYGMAKARVLPLPVLEQQTARNSKNEMFRICFPQFPEQYLTYHCYSL